MLHGLVDDRRELFELFLTGVLTGVINVLVMSIIQRRTADAFRGRVLGLHAMMTRLLMPIGLVGGGALADLTGRNVPGRLRQLRSPRSNAAVAGFLLKPAAEVGECATSSRGCLAFRSA